MSKEDLPNHPLCCIEDFLKHCLEPYELYVTVVCDLDRCWCVPEEINAGKCGINIVTDGEATQDIDVIGVPRSGGSKPCGPGVDSITAQVTVEIYAYKCEGSKRKAKTIHALVQRAFCECAATGPFSSLKYDGMTSDTISDSNEQEYTIISQQWSIDYTMRHCNSKIIVPKCGRTLNVI